MENGAIFDLDTLIYNQRVGNFSVSSNRYRVLLFKSATGNLNDNQYDLTIVNPASAVQALGLDEKEYSGGKPVEWIKVLEVQGGYVPGSDVWFQKSTSEIQGTFVINPIDPTVLTVTLDADTFPANTDIVGSTETRGTIDAIIDPYKYNPLEVYGTVSAVPVGIRFLMLDDINNSANRGDFNRLLAGTDSSQDPYDGPDGWKDAAGSDPMVSANSIIEWDGATWSTLWEPGTGAVGTTVQNIRTGIKYRWDGTQWLKAFEGEYGPGEWNFKLI
jgi:hypothetical protein